MIRAALAAAAASAASAKLLVPAIFQDNCVLQTNAEYGARSRVYGRATPGVGVAVSLARANLTTTAGADGAWAVTLNPLPEGEAVDFVISTDEGEAVAIKGCVAGDVYLCGGQRCVAGSARARGRAAGSRSRSIAPSPPLQQHVLFCRVSLPARPRARRAGLRQHSPLCRRHDWR